MAHVAAALKKCDHDVLMIDMMLDDERLETVLSDFKPDYVGLSLRNIDDVRIDNTKFFVPDLENVKNRVSAISHAPIVVGGSAFSLFPEKILALTGADYGVVGEGERSFPMLIDALCTDSGDLTGKLQTIPGLVYRDGTTIKRNENREINPADITSPERPAALFESYLQTSTMGNIQTQRGCSFTCCYCTYPLIEGNCIRRRPAVSVVDDMQEAIVKGAKYFFVVDSVFNTTKEHVIGICEEIIKRGIKTEWGCFLRPKGITQDLMALMARAGLRHIEFGSDSLCDETLSSYGKNFTFEDIYDASECARKEKVHYSHFLIIGGPGETVHTIQKSYENSLRLKKTAIFPYVGMRVYPGTPLYKTAVDEKIISPENDLLQPYFYLSPDVTRDEISGLLEEFHRKSPQWIINDPNPDQLRVLDVFRRKGLTGPLWEFLVR
jgi:radical SAM superfamily enzyme YgiQ (UPF0313 family)